MLTFWIVEENAFLMPAELADPRIMSLLAPHTAGALPRFKSADLVDDG